MPVTYAAFTTLSDKDRAEALGAALERLDPAPTAVGVIEIEEDGGLWEVAGYFTAAPDLAGLALLALVQGARDFAVSEVPETDWVAQVRRDLTPVEAGRFFVHGAHDAHRLPEGRIGLLIEAAMAFGTGHHATTQGCLLALDRLAEGPAPARVADIGAGTAVLAMAAQHLWPSALVVASDIDPVAVEVAQANVRANGLPGIRCLLAAGLDHPDLAAGGFDLILANILKGPLIDLAPAMGAAIRPGGVAILSGVLVRQAAEVIRHYRASGYDLVDEQRIGDWATLVLRARAGRQTEDSASGPHLP